MADLSPETLASLRAAALEIAAAARAVPLAHFRAGLAVEAKADESPVTLADRATETRLREEIARRFPGHGILGEEFGTSGLERDFVWVVDPIDGTKSFITGHPMWGMLIGLLHHGAPVLGIVQMPALGELALGIPGAGAWLNGAAIRCRTAAPPEACLNLNEVPRMLASPDRAACEALLSAGRYSRATADCYSYVQLAAGWIDGVVDYGLEPYDYLPVLPLVEAAGGVMTDWQGNRLGRGSDGRVVAGSPAVHAHLLEVIAKAGRG